MRLVADEVNLIRAERFARGETNVRAMIRYRAEPAPARATIEEDRLHLTFEQPQRAIAPGQLVAFFDPASDEVLGAATICEAL
jgi:tRNA-specific 2-thiouridylase